MFYVQRRFHRLWKTFRRSRTPFRCSPKKCSASLPELRSPCGRNRVHLSTGMPFGFPPEPRSDATAFITKKLEACASIYLTFDDLEPIYVCLQRDRCSRLAPLRFRPLSNSFSIAARGDSWWRSPWSLPAVPSVLNSTAFHGSLWCRLSCRVLFSGTRRSATEWLMHHRQSPLRHIRLLRIPRRGLD